MATKIVRTLLTVCLGCLLLIIIIAACEASPKKNLLNSFPGYEFPVPPGGILKDGPYSIEGDLDRDGKKDFISLLVAPDKKWLLAVVFSKTEKAERIYEDSAFPFSKEMDLSLFYPKDFEKWKKRRPKGEELLEQAKGISFNPFAIVLSYGETSAQAFYWKKDRFESFWVAD